MLKKSLQPVCIVSALNSSCFIKITGGKMNFFKSGSDILPTDITDRAHTEKYRNEGGVNRREFLAMASTFGATTASAYAMLGMSMPALIFGLEHPVCTRIGNTIQVAYWDMDPVIIVILACLQEQYTFTRITTEAVGH